MEKSQFLFSSRVSTSVIKLLTVVPIVLGYLQGLIRKRSLQKVLMTDLHMTHEEALHAINEAKRDIEILILHDPDAVNHYCRERWGIDYSYIDEIELDN